MDLGRIIKTTLVAGIVANAIDYVSFTFLFTSYMQLPFMNPMPPIAWLVIGDFVAALIFVVVFARVRGSFGPGAMGGMTYGLYAGILMNFPVWIFMHLIVKDWSYGYSWFSTIYGIVWAVIVGAAAGAVFGAPRSAQTAAP
jgi:hypothetical protein